MAVIYVHDLDQLIQWSQQKAVMNETSEIGQVVTPILMIYLIQSICIGLVQINQDSKLR